MIIIKGIDGITLDDNGIFERGQRAKTKVADESSGFSKKEISEILANDSIDNVKTTLNKLGIDIRNKEDNTYRNIGDILNDLIKMLNDNVDIKERYKGTIKSMADVEKKVAEAYESYEAKSKMDKLEELCKPISDYLRENYNPYYSIVITGDNIRLVQDQIGIPVNVDYEKEDEEIIGGTPLRVLFDQLEPLDEGYDKIKSATDKWVESLNLATVLTKILNEIDEKEEVKKYKSFSELVKEIEDEIYSSLR